ncbi:glycoside hydrolase family 16 protein [Chiua virens]|nr:glycoside hydrolase family 16 protein [Chiua virens]
MSSPFFIGEQSTDSRPSTAGTNSNPFSTPDLSSRGPTPPNVEQRQNVSIAVPADVPRSPSYYGSRPAGFPNRTSSGLRIRESLAPPPSRPLTAHSTLPSLLPQRKSIRMRSTLLEDPSTIEKPWIKRKDPYQRISYYVTYGVAFLGIVASAIRCYFGYKSVPMLSGNLCLVLDEEFNTDTDTVFGSSGNWFREIELGGFGNGEFEMTTDSTNNSYVQNGYLYITPTLTSDAIGVNNVLDGYSYNLTDCTYNITNPAALPGGSNSNTSSQADLSAYYQACGAVSNATSGTVVPPVQSARISTRNSASIRYGKVEVIAKASKRRLGMCSSSLGIHLLTIMISQLWPAIWMLPVNNTYGPWPQSGEIDIMESRGNAPSYPNQGIDYVRGSLNWGPLPFLNAFYKTFGWWTQRRTDYGEAFHTYVLEWDSSFLRMYVDSRLNYMLQLPFNEPFFTRGDFPTVVENGTTPVVLTNPWINGTNATPFDQPFYLILDLAVGGTNGWFPDNVGNKPWLDGSNTAMRSFINAQNQWYPTWGSDGESSSFVVYVRGLRGGRLLTFFQ